MRGETAAVRVTPGVTAAAGLAACSLLVTTALAGAALFRIATNAYGATGDFLSFYVAGHMVRTGRGADLYDPIVQETLQRAQYPGGFEDAIGYPLPVFAAWMFAPFSALPFTAAFFLWMTLNAALLCGLAWLLARHLQAVSALPRRVFVATFALSIPAVTAIVFGQVDLIVFAGLFGGYLLLRDGRPYAAGAALAAVLLKPHFLGGVVLMLVVWREWRTLAALCGIALPLLTLPALLTSPAALAGNLSYIGKYPGDAAATEISINADKMSNWRGFVVSATGQGDAWLWLPGLAVIAVVALVLAMRAWRRGPGDGAAFDQVVGARGDAATADIAPPAHAEPGAAVPAARDRAAAARRGAGHGLDGRDALDVAVVLGAVHLLDGGGVGVGVTCVRGARRELVLRVSLAERRCGSWCGRACGTRGGLTYA